MRALSLFRYLSLVLPAIRLAWGLLWDRRVGLPIKVLPVIAALYVLSPIDLLPDIIPVLGWADDLVVAGGLLLLFFALAPREVVLEHLSRRKPPKTAEENAGPTVDGSFRYTDDDPPA